MASEHLDQDHHSLQNDASIAPAPSFYQLPLRVREQRHHREPSVERPSTPKPIPGHSNLHKRFPESLHLNSLSLRRLRSPTESSLSSLSSANIPDSATTCSLSTLASPISTSYASDIQDLMKGRPFDASRSSSRVRHRHQPSSGTCSTFVNEDDFYYVADCPDFSTKLARYQDDEDVSEIQEESPTTPVTGTPIARNTVILSIEKPDSPSAATSTTSDEVLADWETASSVSDSAEDADAILNYTLQLAYGIDLNEAGIPAAASRKLIQKFVRDVGELITNANQDAHSSQAMTVSSSSTTPSQGEDGSQRGEKRKKKGKLGGDDGEDLSDGEGSGSLPPKRLKPTPKDDDNLRLSCPYRKRNPHRFNVREHHSCAMTYFPKFAELRQHIVKQHKRDDPSAFVCDRCNRDFPTRKELRDHGRQPKEHMCDIDEHDPESGIDGPTSNKLLSRKRASGSSPEIQWREIWNILFPDDDEGQVQSYYFTPVIEHFELSSHFLASFDNLHSSLRDKISNPATLETLSTKFTQCFMETMERCIADAQNMPYVNRSNKRNEVSKPHTTATSQAIMPRKPSAMPPSRPDSGVVLDDGSEESGSIVGAALQPRDSIRTLRGGSHRGSSNLAPNPLREVRPAPVDQGIFDEALLHSLEATPMTLGSNSMDPASVQAWTDGVFFPGDTGHGLPGSFDPMGELMPNGEMPDWTTSFHYPIGDVPHEFTGFPPPQ